MDLNLEVVEPYRIITDNVDTAHLQLLLVEFAHLLKICGADVNDAGSDHGPIIAVPAPETQLQIQLKIALAQQKIIESPFADEACWRRVADMPAAVEAAPHIIRDTHGVAWVDDTNVKVVELALDHLAYGWSAEAIHEQFPHLTLAQIHAALAFFYDHQSDFEQEILRRERDVASWKSELGESPLQKRLRQLKSK